MKITFDDFMAYCMGFGLVIIGLYFILFFGLKLYLTFEYDFRQLKKDKYFTKCAEEKSSIYFSDEKFMCIKVPDESEVYFKEPLSREEWLKCIESPELEGKGIGEVIIKCGMPEVKS